MLWIGAVVAMIDGHLRRAAALLLIAAGLCAFGIIHSVDPAGGLHWPWQLDGLAATINRHFSAAYVALAALLALLSLQRAGAAR